MFEGVVATDKPAYLNKSIRHLVRKGAQNDKAPIGYAEEREQDQSDALAPLDYRNRFMLDGIC
jgi:hypothetical protein